MQKFHECKTICVLKRFLILFLCFLSIFKLRLPISFPVIQLTAVAVPGPIQHHILVKVLQKWELRWWSGLRWLWVGACSSCHEHNNPHLRSKMLVVFLCTWEPTGPRKKISTVFRKNYSNMKFFHCNPHSGRSALFRAYRRTDMTKLIVAFSRTHLNTLRTRSFKLFKPPFPGFLKQF